MLLVFHPYKTKSKHHKQCRLFPKPALSGLYVRCKLAQKHTQPMHCACHQANCSRHAYPSHGSFLQIVNKTRCTYQTTETAFLFLFCQKPDSCARNHIFSNCLKPPTTYHYYEFSKLQQVLHESSPSTWLPKFPPLFYIRKHH